MSEPTTATDPAAITAGAKSNLAFALLCLPKKRREDMVSFYAFCRVVDDIADEPGFHPDERRTQLARWVDGLRDGFESPEPVAKEIVRLREEYKIPNEWLLEIIQGMEMDIDGARYQTFEDLQKYCYRVACAVGLVSMKIFGANDPASELYALDLGYSLQLTNILRDVGEDAAEGRIYIPLEDLERFKISEADILERKGGPNFNALMEFEADRAVGFFDAAEKGIPAVDRRALGAARRMSKIYHCILKKMRADGFRVYDRRYRLGRVRMIAILLGL